MNKTALITGASSGLGKEFARIFAREGNNVVITARSKEKLESLAKEIQSEYGIEATVIPVDLGNMDEVQELYETIKNKGITIDYLVNNAGFGMYELFHEADYARQEQMIQLNITALTKLCHLYINEMKKQGSGRILNVASTAAFQPGPTMAVYYATKAYVLHFSEAIANELKDSNITVTTLCPGATKTEFMDVADLHESRLVKGRKLPSAKEVSEYGYKKMMKGKLTVIPGLMNKIGANSVRFMPRKMVLKVVRTIQGKA